MKLQATFTAVLALLVSFSTIPVKSSSFHPNHNGLDKENADADVDIILSCIRDPDILPHLQGWEDLTFQDFEQVLLDPSFDINDLPWWRLDLPVLGKVIRKSVKAIIMTKENDKYLSHELIKFVLNREGDLYVENGKAEMDAPQSDQKKITLVKKAPVKQKNSSIWPLWMAIKLGSGLNQDELENYNILYTTIWDQHIENMHNSKVISRLFFKKVSWIGAREDSLHFDINKVPWHFWLGLRIGLKEILRIMRSNIFINSENDFYLTTDFINEAAKEKDIWKSLRLDDAVVAADIPNYIKLMVLAADHIKQFNFTDAIFWSILTDSLNDGSDEISFARERLSKRFIYTESLSKRIYTDLGYVMDALRAGLLEHNSPMWDSLSECFRCLTPMHEEYDFNALILFEHFPVSFGNQNRLSNPIFLKIFLRGGEKQRGRMARSFFIALIYGEFDHDYPTTDFIQDMIETFPEEWIDAAPESLKNMELNPQFLVVAIIDDEFYNDILSALIQRDSSVENIISFFGDEENYKTLYRQICNEGGRPLVIEFAKIFKGQIPDYLFKRIMRDVWVQIVSDPNLQEHEIRPKLIPVFHYFVLNNLLTMAELSELNYRFGLFYSTEMVSSAINYSYKYQRPQHDAVVYWTRKDLFNREEEHESCNQLSTYDRRLVHQFFTEEGPRRFMLTQNLLDALEPLCLLDALEPLCLPAEESVTIPSIDSVIFPPRVEDESDDMEDGSDDIVLKSMEKYNFILQCGDENIEITGEIAVLVDYLRDHFSYILNGDNLGNKKATDNSIIISVNLREDGIDVSKMFLYVINRLKMFRGLVHEEEDLVRWITDDIQALLRFVYFLGINL